MLTQLTFNSKNKVNCRLNPLFDTCIVSTLVRIALFKR